MLRVAGDADARADVEDERVDLAWALERYEQPLGASQRFGLVAHAVHDRRELVTAESGQQPARTERLREPGRDPLQHAVAELMAERVVDRLEVIEVDDHHRHA